MADIVTLFSPLQKFVPKLKLMQGIPWICLISVACCGIVIWASKMYPPIGVAVAMLGLVGCLFAIFPPKDDDRLSRVVWCIVFVALTWFEVRNLYRDRDAHDESEREGREEQKQSFERIAGGIKVTLSNVKTTMDRVTQTLDTAEEVEKNTMPRALIYFKAITLAQSPFRLAAGVRMPLNVNYTNGGSDAATRMSRFF